MSNDPSGNYLFAASIGQDAQLVCLLMNEILMTS